MNDTVSNETTDPKAQTASLASPIETGLLVLFLLLSFLLMISTLFAFWPDVSIVDKEQIWAKDVSFFGLKFGQAGNELRLFILVVVAGALGSFIHVATSAGDYIGNRKLVRSWIYWYLLRLPVGSSLALLVYLLLRGGILTGAGITTISGGPPFGIVGISALAGMFAKKASNKLGEVFDTVFKTDKDKELADKINLKPPILEQIDPDSLTVEDSEKDVKIDLIGKNFQSSSRVYLDDEIRKPIFVSEEKLTLVLKAQDVEQPRIVKVAVETAGVENGRSAVKELEIKSKPDPAEKKP
jgi:hypothetical protein